MNFTSPSTFRPNTARRTVEMEARARFFRIRLALYCPVKGGRCVVGETVRELARRVGADVVVLDCVQLVASSV